MKKLLFLLSLFSTVAYAEVTIGGAALRSQDTNIGHYRLWANTDIKLDDKFGINGYIMGEKFRENNILYVKSGLWRDTSTKRGKLSVFAEGFFVREVKDLLYRDRKVGISFETRIQ